MLLAKEGKSRLNFVGDNYSGHSRGRLSFRQDLGSYIGSASQLRPRAVAWIFCESLRRARLTEKDYCKTMLLSYPRSGNHLVRYLVESIFLSPSLGAVDAERYIFPQGLHDLPIFLRAPGLAPKTRRPVLVKRHFLEPSDNFSKLVLLVRDPVEAVLSHLRESSDEEFEARYRVEVARYLNLLRAWGKFSSENRFLLEYNAVVADDLPTLRALACFLGASENQLGRLEGALQSTRNAETALERPPKRSSKTYGSEFTARAETLKNLLSQSKTVFDNLGYVPSSLF